MHDAQLDEFRGVIVGVLDKLNQLEDLFKPLLHKAEAQAAIAEIHAYRVTARGFLARLRMLNAADAGGEGVTPAPPTGEHTNLAAGRARARVNPHNIEKSGNRYRDANR